MGHTTKGNAGFRADLLRLLSKNRETHRIMGKLIMKFAGRYSATVIYINRYCNFMIIPRTDLPSKAENPQLK